MNKILQWMFLLALIGVCGTAQSQVIYHCDFEDNSDISEWTMTSSEYSNNCWKIGSSVSPTVGGKSLYVTDGSDQYGYTNATTNSCFICAYHIVNIVETGYYSFAYDWMCGGESNYDYMRIALVPNDLTIPTESPSNFHNSLPEGWISLDNGYKLNLNVQWQHSTQEAFLQEGSYKFIVCWRNDLSVANGNPGAFDNLRILQRCSPPNAFNIYDYRPDGFIVRWQSNSNCQSWDIEYGPTGFSRIDGEGVYESAIDTNYFVFSDLTENTSYDIYFHSNCGDGESSIDTMITVSTLKTHIDLPYYCNFVGDTKLPSTWILRHGDVSIYGYDLCLGYNSCVALPKVAVPEWGLSIDMNVRYINSGNLEVGYVTDLSTWDYHRIKSFVGKSKTSTYQAKWTGDADMPDSCYLVLQVMNQQYPQGYYQIDDISIQALNSVEIPSNIVFSNFGDYSVDIDWTYNTDNASFQLRYFSYNDTSYVMVHDTTHLSLNNLDYQRYGLQIRMLTDSDTSVWSDVVYFAFNQLNLESRFIHTELVSDSSVYIYWTNQWSNKFTSEDTISEYLFEWTNNHGLDSTIHIPPTNTSYLLSGLSPTNTYIIDPYAVVGNDTIEMSDEFSFKTENIEDNRMIGGDVGVSYSLITGNYCSYSQAYYPSSGAVGIDTLTGVAYYSDNAEYQDNVRNIRLFVGFTDKYVLCDKKHCIDTTDMTLVYRGSYSFKPCGWDTIIFDQPIVIDHNKNIVISMCDSSDISTIMRFTSHYGYSLSANTGHNVVLPNDENDIYSWNYPYSPDISFVGTASGITYRNPRINRITPGPSSLSYAWDKVGTETSWTVSYRQWGTSQWIVAIPSTTQQSCTLDNLVPGAVYEVRIGSLAGQDTLYTYSMDIPSNGLLPVPYLETFASEEINNFWKTSQKSEIPEYVYIDHPHMLYMQASSYVILPKFNAPINELMLSLYIHDKSDPGAIAVGVCNDRNGIYSFQAVDTIIYNRTTPQSCNSAYLNSYTGTGEYLALQVLSGSFLIDSLLVDYIPDCIQPSNLKVCAVGLDSIQVAWQSDGSEQAWKVSILRSGDNPTNAQIIESTSLEATFTQLQPNTSYTISVQSVCGNTLSESISINTRTLNFEPLPLPFVCDFSDSEQNSKWSSLTLQGQCQWQKTFIDLDSSLYIQNVNTLEAEEGLAVAYIPIHVETSGLHHLSFDWYNIGSVNIDFLYAALAPCDVNFAEISNNKYIEQKLDNWIYFTLDGLISDTPQSFDLSVYIPEGIYYLTFIYVHHYPQDDEPIVSDYKSMIDNIVLEYAPCAKVIDAQVLDVSTNTAFLAWSTEYMNSDGWSISLDNGYYIRTDTPYTIADNLNPSTNYTAEIRSNCGMNQGTPTVINFSTKCGPISRLPYYNDFEVETDNTIPHCWNIIDGDILVKNQKLDCQVSYQSDCIFALPSFADNIDFSNAKLVFNAKHLNYTGNGISIALTNDLDNLDGYTWIANVNLKTYFQHFVIDLRSYSSARYIVFKINSDEWRYDYYNHKVYIDNIGVLPYNVCDYPIQLNVTSNGWDYVQVNWHSNSEQSEWEVMISDMDNHPIEVAQVLQPSYTFTNLTQGTEYKVQVRALCYRAPYENFNYGEWTDPIVVTTNCGIVSDISISNITNNSAKVSWVPNGNQSHWNVLYGKSGFYPEHIDEMSIIDTDQPEAQLTNLVEGTAYEVYIKSMCSDNNFSMSMPVYFTANNGGVNIDAIQGDYTLDIYPNPTSGHSTIHIQGAEGPVNILVVDINGRTILQESIECNSQCEKQFDLTHLPHGTYFVKVVSSNINSVRKLIVK